MAVNIHPILLEGPWTIGYALDIHTIKSTLLGESPFGNKLFDNVRSEMGELLYDYKYKNKRENLDAIVETVISFLEQHPEMTDFESVIPVPPTTWRPYQPTYEIAEAVAKHFNAYYCDDILEKQSNVQLKGMSAEDKSKIGNFIQKKRTANREHNVLLIDDLIQTGTTLGYCVERLKDDPMVRNVYVLAITKTKNQ